MDAATTAGLDPAKAAGTRASLTRRWVLLSLIVVAGILNFVDRQVIAVLKPLIEQDMHWTDADYGAMASLFQFAAASAFLVTGPIVDRLGAKWGAPAGVAAWSLAAISHAWAVTTLQFSAARVALGATESMGTPSYVKTIGAMFSTRMRSIAFGLTNGASNIGALVSPLVLPAIAAAVGWRSSFIVVGLVGFVWVVAWVLCTRGVDLKTDRAGSSQAVTRNLRAAVSSRASWGVWGAKALSDQVWWLMLFWAPDFFHRVFGLTVAQLGPPLAVVYGMAGAGSVLSGWVASRLLARGYSVNAVRKGLMLVCALLVTPVPLAVLVHDYWLAVGLLGLTLAAHQGFSTNVFATITDIVPKARVGSVTSLGSLSGNFAGMASVYVAGQVLTAGLGYMPLLLTAAVSYLLALGWLQLWEPRLERAEEL